MNAEEIRAEAIERVARRMCQDDPRESADFDSAYTPPEIREHYRRWATPFVDALGDLLPTSVEKRLLDDGSAGFATSKDGRSVKWFATAGTQQRRYVTEWRTVDE